MFNWMVRMTGPLSWVALILSCSMSTFAVWVVCCHGG